MVIARVNELMTCYRFHADLLINQGRNTEALDALKLYLIHCPDDKESYALLESIQPREEGSDKTAQESEGPAALSSEEFSGSITQPPETEMPDIYTATLAEVYFSQGKLQEAIATYEKVIEKKHDDAGSVQRLGELRDMMEKARLADEKERDQLIRKKKMVSILETWLKGIHEQSDTGLSAG